MLSGGSIALGILILWGMGKSGHQFWNNLKTAFVGEPPAPQVDIRSLVIQQVRDASELTTAVFTMEAVVPTQQDAKLGDFVIGTTKLLYVAYGQVRAGVDLSLLTPQDVQIQGNQLLIRLPAPQLLDSKIDVSRSRVYDYNRGFLGLGPDTAPGLQSLAQQQALEKIVAAACQESVLERANTQAKLVVSQLIRVPPYQDVLVTTQPPGACGLPSAPAATPPQPLPPSVPLPSPNP
jgi:hypothetical protein